MLTQHPLEWTEEDIVMWRMSYAFPCDSQILAGFDGVRLWNLTRQQLDELNDDRPEGLQMQADDIELICSAALHLREYSLNQDMMAALKLQAEDAPALAVLEEEFGGTTFDQSYCGLIHAHKLEKQRVSAADAELAARLAQEADFGGANLRLVQEEEQRRLDGDLARRVERVQDEASVQDMIDQHGQDVITEPVPDETSGNNDLNHESLPDALDPECMACTSQTSDPINLVCEHTWCCPCMRTLFDTALKDASMLPVSCCQKTIPQEIVQKVLSKDEENLLVSRLKEKLATNKMYCANMSCSKLLDLDQLTMHGACVPPNGIFDCVSCGLTFCMHCKSSAAAHGSGPCAGPSRADEEALVDLAAEQGWKRCPSCTTFVSLKSGCNHITCVCHHEFCFECGIKWQGQKPCTCVMFNEEMLLRENARRVDEQEEWLGRVLEAPERDNIFNFLVHQNIEGEECSHRTKETLEYVEFSRPKNSRRPCESCDHPLPSFCYKCTECQMRFCKVCRYNRRLA